MARKLIGKITHYFPNISVAVLALKSSLEVGQNIEIEKDGAVVKQTVKSMQVEHKALQKAKKGMEVGLKVEGPVKVNSSVYLV